MVSSERKYKVLKVCIDPTQQQDLDVVKSLQQIINGLDRDPELIPGFEFIDDLLSNFNDLRQ